MTHTVTLFGNTYSWATVIACLVLTLCVGLVVLGGIQRISKVAQVVVPFYGSSLCSSGIDHPDHQHHSCSGCYRNHREICFYRQCFGRRRYGTMIMAMQKGIQRGIFSNESGLGSAPIAAAAAQTKESVRQVLSL